MVWVRFGPSMYAYCTRVCLTMPLHQSHLGIAWTPFHETLEDSFSEQLNCSTKPGMSMHTVAPLCDFPQDSRILRHNPEQRTRSARGGSTTLFPILQRAHRDPKQLSELRLRKPGALTYGAYRRHSDHATVLSALDFANAFKNFQSYIAFCLSHQSLPYLAKYVGGDIFHHVLGVKCKHLYLSSANAGVVDHSNT